MHMYTRTCTHLTHTLKRTFYFSRNLWLQSISSSPFLEVHSTHSLCLWSSACKHLSCFLKHFLSARWALSLSLLPFLAIFLSISSGPCVVLIEKNVCQRGIKEKLTKCSLSLSHTHTSTFLKRRMWQTEKEKDRQTKY